MWKLKKSGKGWEERLDNKGFLGPISDDLPSLIPLVFALVVFFSVFSYSFGIYDKKTKELDLYIESIKIAKIILGNSYFDNNKEFESNAKKVLTHYFFVATIIKSNLAEDEEEMLSEGLPLDELGNTNPKVFETDWNNGVFFYTNAGLDSFEWEKIKNRRFFILHFPVAVNKGDYVVDAELLVVVWK